MPLPRFSFRCLVGALASIAFVVTLPAQQAQPPTPNPKTVNVLVTVHDKHGRVVTNLSQSDFHLEEEGRPQNITSFTPRSDQPLILGVLVETALNRDKAFAQQLVATGKFIDGILGDQDKAFVFRFDREVTPITDLTSSKQKLKDGLALIEGASSGTGSGDSSRRSDSRRGDPLPRLGTSTVYDAVHLAATEIMRKQPVGRKAIVVLTESWDIGSKMRDDQALEAALRVDTMVYFVVVPRPPVREQGQGPWNQPGAGAPISRRPGYPGSRGGSPGRSSDGNPRYPSPQPPSLSREERGDVKLALQSLAKQTGGEALELSKKLSIEQGYQQIEQDLRNQYNLGYISDRPSNASKFYGLLISVKDDKNKKDLQVQARDGYYLAGPPEAKPDARKSSEAKKDSK